ncbi:MAG: hypothetical protein ABIC91_03385 [Nanoarchaeota archaeon]|nr:hypothetical protein [Nanoarchaeota archaeon]MBU1030032.1 hypothetical protein [Nanoarchaeota archaeon]MBU1849958.1 hypothetical protein [Nanoarchaeota archaeon]
MTFKTELIPTEDEIKTWLVSTLQHACHVEYFLGRLNLGTNDPQRPHDLVGPGNKYSWNIIKGFALQYRNPKPDFQIHIMPALNLHRQQYHHQKWNDPNPNDRTKPVIGASEDDMLVGAVDAVCSLLENRGYQGGTHDYNSVIEIAKTNPPHKTPWMLKIIPEMSSLQQPSLEQITSLNNFPNLGLKDEVYDSIVKRTCEVVETLRQKNPNRFNF